MLSENNIDIAKNTVISQKALVKMFIEELERDLEALKGESYQRHIPEYYDECEYFNWFHSNIPQALLLSDAYDAFIHYYRGMGKNLYDSVSAFIVEAKRLFYVNK